MMLVRRLTLGPRLCLLAVLFLATACGGVGGGSKEPDELFLMTGQVDLVQLALPSGERKVLLHFADSSVLDPAITPDGQRIAFVRAPDVTTTTTDFGTDIYTANRDGSSPTLLIRHAAPSEVLRWPQWLADGQTLVFQVQALSRAGLPTTRLERYDLNARTRSLFMDGASTPSISRDGRTIVCWTSDIASGQETIWAVDVTSGARQPIVRSTPKLGSFGAAVLSPDGSQLVFGAATLSAVTPRRANEAGFVSLQAASVQDGLPEDVWLANRDGSGLRRLAQLGEDLPSFAWSRDSRWVYSLGGSGLWRFEVASGDRKRIDQGVPHGVIVAIP